MSNLIKLVNRQMPEASIEVELAEWPLISAKNVGTIRSGAGWEIHVPSKVKPFDVVKELEFDLKPGDDSDDLNLVIVQAERRWGPLFVEAPNQIHVVFREIENEDGEGLEWVGEHDSPPHFLASRVVSQFFSHSEGGAPISSDFSGGIVDLGDRWLEITQSNFDFEYLISQVPEDQTDFLAGWMRRNHLEPRFIVLAAQCNWSNEESRDSFEEAREIVAMDLAKIHLAVQPDVVKGCIEKLTADNPTLRALLLAIEGELSPASELVVDALQTASEEESAHPIFELESSIAEA